MDQKLKERLLGAVIILSVSVFVLPSLFKKNDNTIAKRVSDFYEDDSDHKADLEDEPKLQSQLQPQPRPRLQFKPQAQPSRVISQPELKATQRQATQTTRVWVLRMGIFSHSTNAKSLIESLFSKGYP